MIKIFGAYCKESFENNDNKFYEKGETFIFTFKQGTHIHNKKLQSQITISYKATAK